MRIFLYWSQKTVNLRLQRSFIVWSNGYSDNVLYRLPHTGLLGFWCKLLKTREIEPVCKVCNGRCKILWRKLLSLHFSELLMRNAVTQSHVTSYTCKILWCEKWGANWCRCRAMNANQSTQLPRLFKNWVHFYRLFVIWPENKKSKLEKTK